MDLQDFITNLAEQFDETDASEIQADTRYQELNEWSSLMAISIIAMIDEEYNISVTGADIRNSDTIGALFEVVKSKKNEL